MVACPTVALDLDLLLSCWIIETARSSVLGARGHGEKALKVAERARILARRCSAEGVGLRPDFATTHARWMGELAGTVEESGTLGWFLLQRIGMYVEGHIGQTLPGPELERFLELGAADADEVNAALAEGGMPPVPPPEWPSAPSAPAPEPVRARLGIIGDPHIGARSSDGLVQALVHDLNRQGVDLAVAVGDLTQNGKAELLERARAVLGELEVPWAATLGNHDLWDAMWSGGTGEAGVERFMKVFGSAPHALWEVDGLRLVVINSADPTPSPFPPFDLVAGGFTDDPSETLPGGKISEEVAEWMATIEPGAPTFVVLHHPPYPYLGFPPIVFGLDARSTELVAGLVERTGAWGVFCGHTHRCSLSQLAGVPVIEFPSSKDWPFGYGLVEVGERGWSLNLQPITDRPLVEEASTRAGVLFRRYARGPDEARSFVWRL